MISRIAAWLRLSRLPFYPAAWVAYTLGAAAARAPEGRANVGAYAAGYACIFLLELCTVYCNEYFDVRADALNRAANPFTGGSRMIVDGRITLAELRVAVFAVLGLLAASSVALLRSLQGAGAAGAAALLALGLLLGPGYTVPPFKLSYRGFGELDVALVFGPYLVLSGFFHQGGRLDVAGPWLLSVPLSASILPGIIMAGVIDREADSAVGKKTLAVILGPGKAVGLALAAVAVSAVLGQLLLGPGPIVLALPHAVLMAAAVLVYAHDRGSPRAVSVMMILALSYVLWFSLLPLLRLLAR